MAAVLVADDGVARDVTGPQPGTPELSGSGPLPAEALEPWKDTTLGGAHRDGVVPALAGLPALLGAAVALGPADAAGRGPRSACQQCAVVG
jgi:hypothetical protein